MSDGKENEIEEEGSHDENQGRPAGGQRQGGNKIRSARRTVVEEVCGTTPEVA
jgi:hypothetical protein